MSDQTQPTQSEKKAPVYVVPSDGPVRVKVWENLSSEGRPFYNVTIGRIYTDSATGEIREAKSLNSRDIDALLYQLPEAKRAIHMFNERNRQVEQGHNQTQTHAPVLQDSHAAPSDLPTPQPQPTGLQAQRDAAMDNRALPEKSNNVATPQREHGPEQ